jgi:hypothetical protein
MWPAGKKKADLDDPLGMFSSAREGNITAEPKEALEVC